MSQNSCLLDETKVQEWVQCYITIIGAPPEEEEEATDAQLAALYKRTIVLKQAPYCDFSVWTPYRTQSTEISEVQEPSHHWATAGS